MVSKRNRRLARLLALAQADGVHQYLIASAAGISPPMLTLIVSGERRARPEVARALAAFFGEDPEELFPE